MSRSAIALLSGGLDSGVSLGLWLAQPDCRVSLCLTFDYGQRSVAEESRAAQRLADRYGIAWRLIALPWLADAAQQSGSALVAGKLPEGTEAEPGDADSAAAVWVPARNVVFLAIAASFAEAAGDAVILTGFNREEAETFPDNSAAFVDAMDAVLALGTREELTVCSPTLDLAKMDIAKRAKELGLRAADFWSCYDSGPEPCGRCESCVRSVRAWKQA